jgi:hypothetical protein
MKYLLNAIDGHFSIPIDKRGPKFLSSLKEMTAEALCDLQFVKDSKQLGGRLLAYYFQVHILRILTLGPDPNKAVCDALFLFLGNVGQLQATIPIQHEFGINTKEEIKRMEMAVTLLNQMRLNNSKITNAALRMTYKVMESLSGDRRSVFLEMLISKRALLSDGANPGRGKKQITNEFEDLFVTRVALARKGFLPVGEGAEIANG